jgi:hypothetical protein
MSITETIVFNFKGDYTQVGRPVGDFQGYKAAFIESSSISVKALSAGVVTSGTPYTQRNNEGDTTFLIFNFRGPAGGGLFKFQLDYTVDGPMVNDGGMNGKDFIYWGYKFNVDIANVDLMYTFPFSVTDPNSFVVTPASDVTARTVGTVRVQRVNIPSNTAYSVVMQYPHLESNTAICTRPAPTVLGTILTIVLVCVFVGLCVCITIICSIWGAIRRGLLFGERFGYGPSYGYSSHTTYYEPSHQHYHSGGHHHSGGGHSSGGGISGSSGFAN